MSTSNFYNSENGIFVVPGSDEEWFTSDDLELFKEDLIDMVENKNYEVNTQANDRLIVLKNDLIVAELSFEDGYYSGVQVIVETDKDELEERYRGWNGYQGNDWTPIKLYTPYNKRLIKLVEKATQELKVVARFSNGETIYKEI